MKKQLLNITIVFISILTIAVSCSRLSDICSFKTLRVIYNSNGADAGAAPVDTTLYAAGDTVILAANSGSLARSGGSLAGWSLNQDGSGIVYQPGASLVMGTKDLVLWAVFSDALPATISLLAIPGVTAPVTGETPVTTIPETAQYTGTVSWSPSHSTFAASTVYTATITLTAKAGYTLTGVAENSFTVTGATATNAANSGVVTAVFPKTALLLMVYVPAGRFQRDATETNISVITKPYWMSKYEITREQFLAIMGTDPVVAGGQTAYSSGTTDPVMYVNWYHAIAFCNKLSLAEGLTPVYAVIGVDFSTLTYDAIPTTSNATWNAVTANWDANGYRLPTEMEWMWAAMGAPVDGQNGGTNTTGYLKGYSGSTEGAGHTKLEDYAWYINNSSSKTHPVGTKLPNELGLYDMTGNVWEWCWDFFTDAYPDGTLTDYQGATSATARVRHGGSRNSIEAYCTITYRVAPFTYTPHNLNGFRVVRK